MFSGGSFLRGGPNRDIMSAGLGPAHPLSPLDIAHRLFLDCSLSEVLGLPRQRGTVCAPELSTHQAQHSESRRCFPEEQNTDNHGIGEGWGRDHRRGTLSWPGDKKGFLATAKRTKTCQGEGLPSLVYTDRRQNVVRCRKRPAVPFGQKPKAQ